MSRIVLILFILGRAWNPEDRHSYGQCLHPPIKTVSASVCYFFLEVKFPYGPVCPVQFHFHAPIGALVKIKTTRLKFGCVKKQECV